MKSIGFIVTTFLVICGLGLTSADAQIRTPRPSPNATISQEVGLNNFELSYSRPGMKGRTIFADDGLVPYGKIWRTGANASTQITFDKDVKVEGNEIKAGTYAIYSKPGKDEWQFMIYSDLSLGGSVGRYDAANEVASFTVKPQTTPFSVESMTFMFGDIKDNSAMLSLIWEKTMVSMKIETEVDAVVMKSIESAMAGPSAGEYYTAAVYYMNNDKDLDQALTWMNKSIEMNGERFWTVTNKARLLGKMGKKAEAIAASQHAMKLAKEANNSDYVKINEELIAGWK